MKSDSCQSMADCRPLAEHEANLASQNADLAEHLPDSPSHYKPNLIKINALKSLAQELIIRGFSRRTIKVYLDINQDFLRFIGKSAKEATTQDVKNYLLFKKVRGLSNTSLNLTISALKFYFRQVLKRNLFFSIRRPKKEHYLPVVLSKEEIQSIIDAVSNIKHKLMISLAYGSGLRVSEVINLKVKDINFNELTLNIRQSKGNKDRLTILSEKAVLELQRLIKNKTAEDYVFSSIRGGKLTTRTAQKVFTAGLIKSGIKKSATFHSLRHSFATHLLENGVNIRYLQELLGHRSLKTTQIYTQITGQMIKNIKSPL